MTTKNQTSNGNGTGGLAALSSRVGKLEIGFEGLGRDVKGLAEDLAASGREHREFVADWKRREDQKEDARKKEAAERDRYQRERRVTVPQIVAMVASITVIIGAMFGGLFWVITSTSEPRFTSIEGTMQSIIPSLSTQIKAAVDPLTARQEATTQANLARNEQLAGDRERQAKLEVQVAELRRVVLDADARSKTNAEALIENREADTRSKVEREMEARLREQAISYEGRIRDLADTAIREELRSFKTRVQPSPP